MINRLIHWLLTAVILGLLFCSCSTTRIVKPLAKKEVAIGLDFGGPIIDYGSLKIPLPLTSVSVAYGADSTTTVFGAVQTTDAAYGTIHMEAGVLKDILPAKGRIPGFSLGATSHFLVDIWKGKFRYYPQIDFNFHWAYSRKSKNFMYLSLNSWFDFWQQKAHGEDNNRFYTPTLALGHTFANKRMRYTLEVKYMAMNRSNEKLTVGYNGIAGRGGFGAYIGIAYRFGKGNEASQLKKAKKAMEEQGGGKL